MSGDHKNSEVHEAGWNAYHADIENPDKPRAVNPYLKGSDNHVLWHAGYGDAEQALADAQNEDLEG